MRDVIRNLDLTTAVEDAQARFSAANPRSGKAYAHACAVMPGGNTRTVLHFEPYPLVMAKGDGARLVDIDGHAYTDFLGEYSAGLYGHSHPVIHDAVVSALTDGIVLCAPNRFEATLAAALTARFPSCERVRFTNSGTEANMMALNASRVVTDRSHVMVFAGAYHGGVLYFVHGAHPINAPYPLVIGEYNDIDGTLNLIENHAARLAAILIEPMMGAGGAIAGDREFLQALRDAADRHGIVLIFDEVMTSRLSPGGVQALRDVRPDLTTFGKYLGGGLTFGAFGGRAEIMQQFDPRRADASPHAGTFNNNALTMAAGLAGLTKLYTPEVAVRHNAAGDRFRERLNERALKHNLPVQITGLGSIMCMHFQSGPIRRPADTDMTDPNLRVLFHLEMLHRGYYLAQRGFMSLSLPLSSADYDGFVTAFDDVLDSNTALFASSPAPGRTVSV